MENEWWKATSRKKILITWHGKRGGAGKMVPNGFPRPPYFKNYSLVKFYFVIKFFINIILFRFYNRFIKLLKFNNN